MVHAVRFTFVRVARGTQPSAAWLRPGVDDISDFLVDHVNDLRKRATAGTAANASFKTTAERQLIEDVRSGDEQAFLAAADSLAARLVAEMQPQGQAKPGLLVCATFEADDAAQTAGILKLEVVVPHGAVLEKLESGEENLAAVKDVLDKPGDLQKGLVFPDSRPTSEAVVGDKVAQQEARYFIRAMGVTLEAHESGSARELVKAVAARAGAAVTRRVVQALPSIEPDTPPTPPVVLSKLREVVPELTVEVANEVAQDLATAERPVVHIDVRAPVKGNIQAGSLKITGPAVEVERIQWEAHREGGWVIQIRTDEEPRRSYG